ncbi:uncharacterized protein LOC111864236 [Cryptotermes secundus]|uniref:uncharacterized protein LOC111864236 n=1 Tax=Cryptotermes secundus TaxID=105785 RepID=UPI000CD7D4AD|nr:uncharacterized protein LOC111864236 [Cryptotermes secundus]
MCCCWVLIIQQAMHQILQLTKGSSTPAVWAGNVGLYFIADSARMLYNKYLFSKHFLESDFTTAERVHFNRVQAKTLYWPQWGAVVNTWQQLFDDHLVNTFEAIRS